MMANDADWVADVRRWYFSSRQPTQIAAAPGETPDDIGYEAAQPVLQARHWPDAPARAIVDPN